MANEDQTIVIQIDLENKQYKAKLKETETETQKGGERIGKKFDDSVSKRVNKSFNVMRATIIGAGAAFVGGFLSKKVIDLSNQQIDAVNRLNQAMASAGRFTQAASEEFQKFASEMQKVSVVGDEVTLSALATAQQFAKTNDEAKKLTKAALELSAATGVNLESAVRQLGVTLSGQAGSLGRTVMGVRELTAEQLKAGAAIDLVAERFAGSAQAQTRTFSGAIKQLSNTWGDLLEVIGDFVTKSPALVEVFKIIGEALEAATSAVASFGDTSPIDNMLLAIVDFGRGVTMFVMAPLELMFNTVNMIFRSITTTIQAIITGWAEMIAGLIKLIAPNSKIAKALDNFAKSTRDTMTRELGLLGEAVNNVLDFTATTAVDDFLENTSRRMQAAIADDSNKIKESLTDAFSPLNPESQTFQDTRTGIELITDSFKNMAEGMKESALEMSKSLDQNFKAIGKSMLTNIASGAATAFSAFGRALVTGDNALKAFMNSVLNTFGQIAINLGQQFILQGIAYTWAQFPGGPALIAAGAALAAFGGVLSGLGGGSPQAAGTVGGVPTQPEVLQPELVEPDDVEARGPRTQITVQIQGDVLDSDETGLRIVDLLSEYVDRNGNGVVLA
jgi:hypothetical protein